MVYPLEDGHQSQTGPDVRYITSFMPNAANHYATPPTKRHAANRYVYLPLPGTKPSRKSLRTLSKIINDIFNKDTKTMSSVTHLENFPQSLLYNYSLHCMVNVAYLQSRCFTPAVFKLGSADQRGSATGSHGVRERIPKSSNCLHGF